MRQEFTPRLVFTLLMNSNKGISMKRQHAAASPNDLAESPSAVGREDKLWLVALFAVSDFVMSCALGGFCLH